jgi:signal peptidase I
MKEKDPEYINGKEELYYGVGSFVLEIVKVFFLALVIITPIRMFLFQPFFVQGASMEPNFEDGQYLIVNEFGYKKTDVGVGEVNLFTISSFKSLDRGDVVVFRYPKDPRQFFIKRVVGLPGEKVSIKNSKITIFNTDHPDGIVLNEDYLSPILSTTTPDEEVQVKEDEYFVMGDNRTHSYDSRSFGPIKKGAVIGRVLLRAWPFNQLNIF